MVQLYIIYASIVFQMLFPFRLFIEYRAEIPVLYSRSLFIILYLVMCTC